MVPRFSRSCRSSTFPSVMRETSSRSSTRRDSCVTWRPIISRAQTTLALSSGRSRMMATAIEIGASGLRSSCPSVARNSSLRRSTSCTCASRWLFSRSSCSACSRSAIRCTSSACDRSTARSACRRPRRWSSSSAMSAISTVSNAPPTTKYLRYVSHALTCRNNTWLPGGNRASSIFQRCSCRQSNVGTMGAYSGAMSRRLLARENAQRRPRRRRRRGLQAVDVAADDAVVQVRAVKPVHRRARRARNLAGDVLRVAPRVRLVVRVIEDDEQHQRARAPVRRPRQRLRRAADRRGR